MHKYLVLISIFLAGCSFQARNFSPVPEQVQNVSVHAVTPYTQFNKTFKQALLNHNIKLAGKAPITVEILKEHTDLLETNVSSTTQTRVYRLAHSVDFQVIDQKGKIIVPKQNIRAARNFIADNNRVLASKHEKSKLLNILNKDISEKIIRRLASNETINAISHA